MDSNNKGQWLLFSLTDLSLIIDEFKLISQACTWRDLNNLSRSWTLFFISRLKINPIYDRSRSTNKSSSKGGYHNSAIESSRFVLLWHNPRQILPSKNLHELQQNFSSARFNISSRRLFCLLRAKYHKIGVMTSENLQRIRYCAKCENSYGAMYKIILFCACGQAASIQWHLACAFQDTLPFSAGVKLGITRC